MPSSTIAGVSPGTVQHIMAAVGIYTVDSELPAAIMPSQRAIEILQTKESLVLEGRQHPTYLIVALLPQITVQVELRADTHEIVEVDLIDCLILGRREIQLVGHLV
jgi:hypothetical protein